MIQPALRIDPRRLEALGPAETVIQALSVYIDHAVHNRPGFVEPDPSSPTGVRWTAATWRQEGEHKVAYRLVKVGKRSERQRLGIVADGVVVEAGRVVGELRAPGLVPEVVTWLYGQVARVWQLDNELAARWASWAFAQDNRDLKVLLAAFMLVQERAGQAVIDEGKVVFHDDDFRAVGEAMCLVRAKHDMNPKMLLRIADVLEIPGVAAINRTLGFGQSGRSPARGRLYKTFEKWLRHREHNPRILEGLVRAGFKTTVQRLARKVGFLPETPRFFETLRWKQSQARDGRRTIAIGVEVAMAESWNDMSEAEICQHIVATRPGWKRLVGLIPPDIGLTRAIMAAAIDAGVIGDADLVILTPTLEELGLLELVPIRDRWKVALDGAENRRAAHIAERVTKADVAEGLREAADKATTRALAEATRGLRVYVIVDKSGSMEGALEKAKQCLAKFVQGLPLDRLHVSVFNTVGREVVIKAPSGVAVEHAFKGHTAGGGTSYAEGVRALRAHGPRADEDALMLFVGDQLDPNVGALVHEIKNSGFRPMALGLLEVVGNAGRGRIVEDAAVAMAIPSFKIDVAMFDDPYAVTRTLRHLIAATPIGKSQRVSLVAQILATPLLVKPVWA